MCPGPWPPCLRQAPADLPNSWEGLSGIGAPSAPPPLSHRISFGTGVTAHRLIVIPCGGGIIQPTAAEARCTWGVVCRHGWPRISHWDVSSHGDILVGRRGWPVGNV